jgi:hypothetical protein
MAGLRGGSRSRLRNIGDDVPRQSISPDGRPPVGEGLPR